MINNAGVNFRGLALLTLIFFKVHYSFYHFYFFIESRAHYFFTNKDPNFIK